MFGTLCHEFRMSLFKLLDKPFQTILPSPPSEGKSKKKTLDTYTHTHTQDHVRTYIHRQILYLPSTLCLELGISLFKLFLRPPCQEVLRDEIKTRAKILHAFVQ
jgi:hypothetical protein